MVSPFYSFIGSVLESSHPMVNSSPPSWELAAGHTQFVPPIKPYNSILQMQIQQHGYPGTVIDAWQDWRTGGGIGWFRSTFATSGFLAHSRLTVHIEWGAYIGPCAAVGKLCRQLYLCNAPLLDVSNRCTTYECTSNASYTCPNVRQQRLGTADPRFGRRGPASVDS